MHICINKLTIIGSDNGLSPAWGQAIIWSNARILLMQTFEQTSVKFWSKFSFRNCTWKCHLENGGYFVSASMCQTIIKVSTWLCDYIPYTYIYIYGCICNYLAMPAIYSLYHLYNFLWRRRRRRRRKRKRNLLDMFGVTFAILGFTSLHFFSLLWWRSRWGSITTLFLLLLGFFLGWFRRFSVGKNRSRLVIISHVQSLHAELISGNIEIYLYSLCLFLTLK